MLLPSHACYTGTASIDASNPPRCRCIVRGFNPACESSAGTSWFQAHPLDMAVTADAVRSCKHIACKHACHCKALTFQLTCTHANTSLLGMDVPHNFGGEKPLFMLLLLNSYVNSDLGTAERHAAFTPGTRPTAASRCVCAPAAAPVHLASPPASPLSTPLPAAQTHTS